jgi:O-antigen/teichoic acid export membrane protein
MLPRGQVDMSRLKKFTHALLSSYVFLGTNIFYTLASVPLALHYLGKAEFGLWALVTQISGYIGLIDLSMSASVGRILIDHKDDRQNGTYGGIIQTGALVGLVQGALVVLAGTALSTLAGSLLRVPPELRHEFVWLMIGQSALLGVAFVTRIFNQLMFAHQRMDVSNYGTSVFFFLALAVMWSAFIGRLGIYSFLVSQAVLIVGNIAVNVCACLKLKLLPRVGEWGMASWANFRELFNFGQGLFLVSVGTQLINASQTVLLTRLLGLETVAIWNVCTRVYTMLTMVVWRILDNSAPGLSEMVARNERARLLIRLRDMAILTTSLSVAGGITFALCNAPFVQIWMMGKINWPQTNNVLLALWFFISTIMRVHTGFVGITKQFGFLRFIFLIEGLVFVGLNLLAYRACSMTLMLGFSIICTLAFSLPYGLWRTQQYFNITRHELADWLRPSWQMAWRLVPLATVLWWLAHGLPAKWQFATNITLSGVCGMILLLRYGLGESLKSELLRRSPAWLQKILAPAMILFNVRSK